VVVRFSNTSRSTFWEDVIKHSRWNESIHTNTAVVVDFPNDQCYYLLLQKEHIETMSISHSSEIPTLAGGMMNMDMIQNRNLSTNLRRSKIICTIGPACWDLLKV
jgi:hypothetical protein